MCNNNGAYKEKDGNPIKRSKGNTSCSTLIECLINLLSQLYTVILLWATKDPTHIPMRFLWVRESLTKVFEQERGACVLSPFNFVHCSHC